ncbi:MAG: ROK family protein [Candidatus Omnitrophica bacterium]|nr:ROK family protein [Candidatus Omnitrophota bacterium]MDD4013797.1 ROK family protein [Candidatus Omnitrophota bacterium]
MRNYVIGVDIGGTKIASGIISRRGKLVKKVVLPTLAQEGFAVSIEQVYSSIVELLKTSGIKKREIEGIGVCAPGPLDPRRGIVHNPPNLKGWREVPLEKLVSKHFKIKTRIENDANAAGMAEVIWGAAKGYKEVFYVTVSTGIGTAVIVDGKIYHGKNGMAGEGGHVTIDYNAQNAVCGCGRIGCIEALASGPGTVRRLRNRLESSSRPKTRIPDLVGGDLSKLNMETIDQAASNGDEVAIEAIKEEGRLLGIWLGGMINLLDPEIIVIGGGVSLIGRPLFDEIRKYACQSTINIMARCTPIVPAKLKKDVGIYGAASVFMS